MITENTRCMPPLRDHREHSLLATRCMTPLGDQTRYMPLLKHSLHAGVP